MFEVLLTSTSPDTAALLEKSPNGSVPTMAVLDWLQTKVEPNSSGGPYFAQSSDTERWNYSRHMEHLHIIGFRFQDDYLAFLTEWNIPVAKSSAVWHKVTLYLPEIDGISLTANPHYLELQHWLEAFIPDKNDWDELYYVNAIGSHCCCLRFRDEKVIVPFKLTWHEFME